MFSKQWSEFSPTKRLSIILCPSFFFFHSIPNKAIQFRKKRGAKNRPLPSSISVSPLWFTKKRIEYRSNNAIKRPCHCLFTLCDSWLCLDTSVSCNYYGQIRGRFSLTPHGGIPPCESQLLLFLILPAGFLSFLSPYAKNKGPPPHSAKANRDQVPPQREKENHFFVINFLRSFNQCCGHMLTLFARSCYHYLNTL